MDSRAFLGLQPTPHPSRWHHALGIRGGGTSLDNTVRIVRPVATQRVHAVDHGFGHGLAPMFAEGGTLLATASQSCTMRFWPTDQDGGRT
jgi:acyl-CoA thioesterase-2